MIKGNDMTQKISWPQTYLNILLSTNQICWLLNVVEKHDIITLRIYRNIIFSFQLVKPTMYYILYYFVFNRFLNIPWYINQINGSFYRKVQSKKWYCMTTKMPTKIILSCAGGRADPLMCILICEMISKSRGKICWCCV